MADGTLITGFAIAVIAVFYSSVGHAGASGYLAAMTLTGVAPEAMRPAALALNVLVAGLGTWRYGRAGRTDWELLLPLALASVPAAFVGGWLDVPAAIYRPLLGVVLLFAAARLALSARGAAASDAAAQRPGRAVAFAAGAASGFLGGVTGTGGGLFLAPALLLFGWAETRTAAGVTAGFILVNSAAALAGLGLAGAAPPAALPLWAAAALAGALVGTRLGLSTLSVPGLRLVLAAILALAGLRLLSS